MAAPRGFRLLTKTMAIYLLFTFLAFFGSALYLTRRAENFIRQDLENHFIRMERHVHHVVEREETITKLPRHSTLTRLQEAPAQKFAIYSDTLIQSGEYEDAQPYRVKSVIFEAHGTYYKFTMMKNFGDFFELKDQIFEALIPAFVLLALVLVLFNWLLSGYFFKPFNRILEQLAAYKIGQGKPLTKVSTSTSEFSHMQELFHEMVRKIETDYRNLKEYTENMAHEIQTPLAIIRNKTENLLSDDSLLNDHAEDVKIIYNETNHLSRLGQTLNLLTKIENNEFSKTRRVFTKDILHRHIEAVRESVRLKNLNIESELSADHSFTMDPFLLDIVIKNILRNAIRYGDPQGPVRIVTDSRSLMISNYGAALDVPPEKLFQRFFKYNGTKPSLGLGLALVARICSLNNIEITYKYEHGQHFFILSGPAVS